MEREEHRLAAEDNAVQEAKNFLSKVRERLNTPPSGPSMQIVIEVPRLSSESELAEAVAMCKKGDWEVEVDRYDSGARFITLN